MRNFALILATIVLSCDFAYSQSDNPYAEFGYEAPVMEIQKPIETHPVFLLQNRDTSSKVAWLVIDPQTQIASFYSVMGTLIGIDTLSEISYARWLTTDPANQYHSPYLGMGNNPVNLIDRTGTVTEVNKNGTVTCVDNQGTDVMQLQGDQYVKIGETDCWDEFAEHNKDGSTNSLSDGTIAIMKDATILQNTDWSGIISSYHDLSKNFSLVGLAIEESSGGLFDIKINKQISPYGPGTGRLLNGKYASAESAGNFLAGMNAAGRTDWFTFMRIAGALHQGGKSAAFNSYMTGKIYGPGPWLGENEYAGRRIVRGWNSGF